MQSPFHSMTTAMTMVAPNANLFSPEEEEFLIHLKEVVKPQLTWTELHKSFTKEYPKTRRTRGGLQVHYSRKLQPSKREARIAYTEEPSFSFSSPTGCATLPAASSDSPTSSVQSPATIFGSPTSFAGSPATSFDSPTTSSGPRSFNSGTPKTPKSSRKSAHMDQLTIAEHPRRALSLNVGKNKITAQSDAPLSPLAVLAFRRRSSDIKEVVEKKVRELKRKIQMSESEKNLSDTSPASFKSSISSDSPFTSSLASTASAQSAKATSSRAQPPKEPERRTLLNLGEAPLVREGWIPANLEILRADTKAPRVFTHPPPNRIVEYHTRSGAYRTRCRREEDNVEDRSNMEQDEMEL